VPRVEGAPSPERWVADRLPASASASIASSAPASIGAAADDDERPAPPRPRALPPAFDRIVIDRGLERFCAGPGQGHCRLLRPDIERGIQARPGRGRPRNHLPETPSSMICGASCGARRCGRPISPARSRNAELIGQLMQQARDCDRSSLGGIWPVKRGAPARCRHRRWQSAPVELRNPGPRHDGIGLRLAGLGRGAAPRRHIGRALLMPRVDHLQPVPAAS